MFCAFVVLKHYRFQLCSNRILTLQSAKLALTWILHHRLYRSRAVLKLAAMGVHATGKVVLRAL